MPPLWPNFRAGQYAYSSMLKKRQKMHFLRLFLLDSAAVSGHSGGVHYRKLPGDEGSRHATAKPQI